MLVNRFRFITRGESFFSRDIPRYSERTSTAFPLHLREWIIDIRLMTVGTRGVAGKKRGVVKSKVTSVFQNVWQKCYLRQREFTLTSDPSLLKRIKYDVPICIPFVDGTVYSASIYDHTLCVIRVLSIVGKSCKDVSTWRVFYMFHSEGSVRIWMRIRQRKK